MKDVGTLKELRSEWLLAVVGPDTNAIIPQLCQLSIDFATFDMINNARALADTDEDGAIRANGLLHELLDRGFVTIALSAIRRQLDTGRLRGDRGVHGLKPLLNDILENQGLLTREAIIEAEALPYEYEAAQRKRLEAIFASAPASGARFMAVTPHDHSELRHEHLDWACGKTKHDRHRNDLYSGPLLKALLSNIEIHCKRAELHATHFVAHAGTPHSRARRIGSEAGITLREIARCHRTLCRSAGFLAVGLLGDSCPAFLPSMSFDPAQYLELGLVGVSKQGALRKRWGQLDSIAHRLSNWQPHHSRAVSAE